MRTFAATLIFTLSLSVASAQALAIKVEEPTTRSLPSQMRPDLRKDPAVVELARQMLTGRAAPIEYWLDVAQCETETDWSNTGRFAGGLGIYTNNNFPKADMGTWERWGGEQFAKSPDKATMTEQIVVANRIAVFGWSKFVVRPDGGKRHGVPPTYTWSKNGIGYNGWGCIKNNRYLDLSRWMSNNK